VAAALNSADEGHLPPAGRLSDAARKQDTAAGLLP